MEEFFFSHKAVFLTFHLLGVAIGLGGATIADTLFFRFLKDFRISKKEAEVMQWISHVITIALLVIFGSGLALFFGEPVRYAQSAAFIFKMTVVVVLTINGILLHHVISPRMVKISFLSVHPHVFERIHSLRRLAFAMGAISATSWYISFFTAMLKSMLPESIKLPHLLLLYVTIVAIAIFVSQLVEAHLHRKGLLSE